MSQIRSVLGLIALFASFLFLPKQWKEYHDAEEEYMKDTQGPWG